MVSGTDFVQISTAARSEAEAAAIAQGLLTARLAACVQVVGPVTSRYWWTGRIETATEWVCLAKTTAERADEAIDAVRALHSYDVPEVVVTPILSGHAAYLAWIADEVGRT